MKVGILGTGAIAHTLADTMRQMPEIEMAACASRTKEHAEAFANEYGIKKAYGSYEELAADDSLDLVYVATPHSRHFEDMKLLIEHGRNVLCEKSFTINQKEAEAIQQLASEKNVYVAEAIWTRYMPSRQIINDAISDGTIGKVHMLTANLSYAMETKKRIMDPELAGGALLDVGVYGLNFAAMHFGLDDIDNIDSSVSMTKTGVDGNEAIAIHYKDGRMAVLTHGVFGRSDRHGIFYGEKGYIVVDNINDPTSVQAFDDNDKLIKVYPIPDQISGYEYELREAAQLISEGKKESTSMPMSETIRMMGVMDTLRAQWGMVYPKEK